jgi:predicted alpha/beta-hydrolase family hydrolase
MSPKNGLQARSVRPLAGTACRQRAKTTRVASAPTMVHALACPMTDTRHLELSLDDGARVAAIATTPVAPLACYVFAHGAGAGMTHPFMEQVVLGLAERQIACLRYQFPYMQAGKRRVDSAAVAHATVRAAVRQADALWPGLAMFAGGKSFGGRMTSQAEALQPLPGVRGLAFLGFPLHPAGKPSVARAAHLQATTLPLLFIRGTRDALAEGPMQATMLATLGKRAAEHTLEAADHGFNVLRRSGTTADAVMRNVLDALAHWMQRHRPAPASLPD